MTVCCLLFPSSRLDFNQDWFERSEGWVPRVSEGWEIEVSGWLRSDYSTVIGWLMDIRSLVRYRSRWLRSSSEAQSNQRF